MRRLKTALIFFAYRHFLRRPQHRIGASLTRAVYGLWLLLFYLQAFPIRDFIWGGKGPITDTNFIQGMAFTKEFSFFTYSASPLWLNLLILAGMASALCLMLGVFVRGSLVLSLLLLFSFHARNGYILDGGDNIGRIVLVFLTFMDCSTFLSVRPRRGGLGPTPLANVLHNIAYRAIALQYCFLYLSSSFAKIAGPLWQNGTALYYVLKSSEFSRTTLASVLSRNYVIVTIASYCVVGLQVAFPFFFCVKPLRVALIVGLVVMHVGIAYFMGLVRFSTVMIAGLLLFIPDESYRRAGRMLGLMVRRRQLGTRKEEVVWS